MHSFVFKKILPPLSYSASACYLGEWISEWKRQGTLEGVLLVGKKMIISVLAKYLNIDKYRISTQRHVLVGV